MKYLCLIYDNESEWQKFPKDLQDKYMGEYMAFGDSIKKSGQYVGANQLQPSHTATVVRSRNGKVSTTDGPFVETKEQLGGYYLVEAKDLNDAIQVASRIPSARKLATRRCAEESTRVARVARAVQGDRPPPPHLEIRFGGQRGARACCSGRGN